MDDQQIVGGSNVPLRVVDFFLGGNWHELPLTRQSVDGVSVPPAYLTYSQLLQITAESGLSAWESCLVKLDEQFLLTLYVLRAYDHAYYLKSRFLVLFILH